MPDEDAALPPGIVVGRLDACAAGRVAKVALPAHDVQILLVRRGEDVLGYLNVCPHLGSPLDEMEDRILTADRQRLVCSAHNAAFSVETGRAVRGLPPDRGLTRVPLTVTPAGEIVTA